MIPSLPQQFGKQLSLRFRACRGREEEREREEKGGGGGKEKEGGKKVFSCRRTAPSVWISARWIFAVTRPSPSGEEFPPQKSFTISGCELPGTAQPLVGIYAREGGEGGEKKGPTSSSKRTSGPPP